MSNLIEKEWTEEKVKLLKDSYARELNTVQFQVFLEIAKSRNLNPFTKQIYAIKYGNTVNYIVGIDGFRDIAHRTGQYLGSSFTDELDDKGNVIAISCTVKKLTQGQTGEFTSRVLMKEFNSKKSQWAARPYQMLRKVAEAHAIRQAFSEAEGLYAAEEFDHMTHPIANKTKEADDFLKSLDNIESVEGEIIRAVEEHNEEISSEHTNN